MIFTSTTPWKPKNVKIFQKVQNWQNWILSVPRVSVRREKKSPWLRQYQSYMSNWYVNGKVFTSTTTWEPKFFFFFSKKFEIEFDLYFDLCWRAEIIQVGLDMHLSVDIGDASSSLWGSTSSHHYFHLDSLNYCRIYILILIFCIKINFWSFCETATHRRSNTSFDTGGLHYRDG